MYIHLDYIYMLLLQPSRSSLTKKQKVCGMRLSGTCRKFWPFTGGLQKMEHEKVLSGSFTAPTVLFLSFNLCRELGSTYCRPDLGNHNAKYEIMISLQGPYRHYWYSSDTYKASLGRVCTLLKRAHWMGYFFRWPNTHKPLISSPYVGHRLSASCFSATMSSAGSISGASSEATCLSPLLIASQ